MLHEHNRLNRLNLLIIAINWEENWELWEVSQGKFHKNNRINLGIKGSKHRTSKNSRKQTSRFLYLIKQLCI